MQKQDQNTEPKIVIKWGLISEETLGGLLELDGKKIATLRLYGPNFPLPQTSLEQWVKLAEEDDPLAKRIGDHVPPDYTGTVEIWRLNYGQFACKKEDLSTILAPF